MKIESITIKNYKSLQNITIDNIPRFSVFVGANGTGKSTLFDVFGFLRDALQNNVRQALRDRGGFREVVARGHEKEDICFKIKFTMKILEKERLVTYLLEIGENDNKIGVKREILRYKRGSYGSPFHFLDFKNGQGYAITNEENFDQKDEELTREDQTLETQDILAIKDWDNFSVLKQLVLLGF